MLAAPIIVLSILFSLSSFSLSINDSEVLLKFKKSLTNTKALESWVPNTPPCNEKTSLWEGIMCDKGILTGVHLSNMGLSGKIDIDALLNLPRLRTVSFFNNSFSGPIPEFNRLGSIRALFLSFNHFSGEIPSDFFLEMEMLKRVWLSANHFSGNIPESLGKLTHLIELHLEQNEFSGNIPDISQKSLNSFDLSNNKLEGTIPEQMSRFGVRSFQDNPRLCGNLLNTVCTQTTPSRSATVWVVVGIIILTIIVAFYLRSRRKEERFSMLRKDSFNEATEARIPSINQKSMDPSRLRQKSGSSQRGSGRGKAGPSDLVVVNDHKGYFGLADLMKAAAEMLGSGGLGSAYKAVMGDGVAVVVKRMKEMNKMSRDTFDAEIRRLGRLSHQNVLTPLAYHYRKEEKLLVCEFVPKGSLLFVLHGDRGISHAELTWSVRLKIIKGVARGLEYLHSELPSYELPHGNLKSTNILLDSNYDPLLSDYALYPLINTTPVVNSLFAFKSPEATFYQQVSPKSDVFCLGIVILEILTRKYPSQYLNNQKGGIDIVQWVQSAISENREMELIDPEITGNSSDYSVGEMLKLLRIGAECTESNLDERIDVREAVRRIEEIQV